MLKYITTPGFNKFFGSIFDNELKQAIATNNNVNAASKCANKNTEKNKKIKCLV